MTTDPASKPPNVVCEGGVCRVVGASDQNPPPSTEESKTTAPAPTAPPTATASTDERTKRAPDFAEPPLHALFQNVFRRAKDGNCEGLLVEKKNGQVVPSKARIAKGDCLMLYFSAEWCPPCRQFTPLLKNFYNALPGNAVKLIFVSRDHSEEEFNSYFLRHHGNWLAMNYSGNFRDALSSHFQVSGIPEVVIVNQNGAKALSRDQLTPAIGGGPPKDGFDFMKNNFHWKNWATQSDCSLGNTLLVQQKTRVKGCFLTSAAHNNGTFEVVGISAESGNRFLCKRVDDPSKEVVLALKRANLLPIGVKDEGTGGVIIGAVDADREQYIVECGPDDRRTVAFSDLKLGMGTPVVCRGIHSAPDNNGRCGIVQKFEAESGKYLVQISHSQILKLKPERLML